MFPNQFVWLFSDVNGKILTAWTKLRHPCPKNDLDLEMTLAFVKNEFFLKKSVIKMLILNFAIGLDPCEVFDVLVFTEMKNFQWMDVMGLLGDGSSPCSSSSRHKRTKAGS